MKNKIFLLLTSTFLLYFTSALKTSAATIYTCICQTDYSGGPVCRITDNGCGIYPAVCQSSDGYTCNAPKNCVCDGAPEPPPPPTNTPIPPPTLPPSTPVPTSPPTGCCRGTGTGSLQCQDLFYEDCVTIGGCTWNCTVPTTKPAPTTNPNACCQRDPDVAGGCLTNCNDITLYNSCIFSSCCQWVASASCPVATPITSCCRAISPAGQYACTIYALRTLQNYLTCSNPAMATLCTWTCEPYNLPTPIPTRPVPRVFCTPPDGGPTDNPAAGGIWTNLGCVPYESKPFASKAITWGLNLAGAIILIVIGFAAFLYVSSGGDPKKVQAARELIIALIGGVALIVFAVLLLNYLGVNLLNLGGLGFQQ